MNAAEETRLPGLGEAMPPVLRGLIAEKYVNTAVTWKGGPLFIPYGREAEAVGEETPPIEYSCVSLPGGASSPWANGVHYMEHLMVEQREERRQRAYEMPEYCVAYMQGGPLPKHKAVQFVHRMMYSEQCANNGLVVFRQHSCGCALVVGSSMRIQFGDGVSRCIRVAAPLPSRLPDDMRGYLEAVVAAGKPGCFFSAWFLVMCRLSLGKSPLLAEFRACWPPMEQAAHLALALYRMRESLLRKVSNRVKKYSSVGCTRYDLEMLLSESFKTIFCMQELLCGSDEALVDRVAYDDWEDW